MKAQHTAPSRGQTAAMFTPIKDSAGNVFAHELSRPLRIVAGAAAQRLEHWTAAGHAVAHDLQTIDAATRALAANGLRLKLMVRLSQASIADAGAQITAALAALVPHVEGLWIHAPWQAAAEHGAHATLQFAAWCRDNAIAIACDAAITAAAVERSPYVGVRPDLVRVNAEVLSLVSDAATAAGLKLWTDGAQLLATGIDADEQAAAAELLGATLFQGLLFGRARRLETVVAKHSRSAPHRAAAVAMAAAGAIALAACGSPPKPAMPDGSNRVEINDPARLATYQRYSMNEQQRVTEQRALQDETAALRRQVEQLQGLMKIMISLPQAAPAAQGTAAPQATPGTATPAGKAGAANAAPAATPKPADKTISATDAGTMFRLFHATGASTFDPSDELGELLLRAARSGQAIEIFGRTDSALVDAANQRVALARAVAARNWLVERGVAAERIRTRYTSAGNFIADNGSDDGRALNRRVEIEVRGVQASALLRGNARS